MTVNEADGAAVIDRADAEATLYRVAICAFTFYPAKPAQEPGYTVEEDVDWCMAPLTGIDPVVFDRLRGLTRAVIIDPTAHRQALTDELAHLTTE